MIHRNCEISIKKSVIFALLYQGLSIIVDYIAYISNNTIISKAGEVQKGYALEGSLVVIFSKITVFLCILLLKKHFGKKSTETLPDKIWGRFLFFPVFTIITIIAMIMTFQYTKNEVQANVLYSISLGLAVMNIFVYFLINDIVTSEAKLHEKEVLGLQFKNQIDMYRSISENYEIQTKIIRINNSSKSMIASAKLFDFFLISNFLCKKHRKINYNISLQI